MMIAVGSFGWRILRNCVNRPLRNWSALGTTWGDGTLLFTGCGGITILTSHGYREDSLLPAYRSCGLLVDVIDSR